MKLFLCTECYDIKAMLVGKLRSCACGQSSARYKEDGDYCELEGKALALGINNSSLLEAVRKSKKKDKLEMVDLQDLNIKAFVFDPRYYKISRVNNK